MVFFYNFEGITQPKFFQRTRTMISQRLNLFYAGFAAFQPSLHYNREALYGKVCSDSLTQQYSSCLEKLKSSIVDTADEAKSHLSTAASLAKYFNLELTLVPQTLSDYFTWQSQYCDAFESRFPMSKIDHYYFLYGRKNAELLCNAGLMQSYLHLHLGTECKLEVWSGLNKCLKDTEYILFKLIAASALLSSEPRQSHFGDHYKMISNRFFEFRGLDPSTFDKSALTKMTEGLQNYENCVVSGFKSCMKLLSDLRD